MRIKWHKSQCTVQSNADIGLERGSSDLNVMNCCLWSEDNE